MQTKQTILFCLPNLNGGGAERVLINIMKYNYSPNEYNVKLLLVDNIGVYFDFIPEYVEVISLDIKRVRNAFNPLVNKINEINPDIVFSTTNRMNLLILIASFFLKNKPKIIVREPNLPSAQIKNKTLKWWHIFLIKLLYKRADKVIAQTSEMKEEICEYFAIKCDKVEVLINPIDKDAINNLVNHQKNPFDSKYINLVAIGRLTYQKGYDILIKSFKKVVAQNSKYRLFILGDGPDRIVLEKLIVDLDLTNYINLLGFKDNPYLYIKYADALVLSSRWEGLPNVVLEAIYLDTFFIATRTVEFLEELTKNNENGYLVNIEDIDDLSQKILQVKNK